MPPGAWRKSANRRIGPRLLIRRPCFRFGNYLLSCVVIAAWFGPRLARKRPPCHYFHAGVVTKMSSRCRDHCSSPKFKGDVSSVRFSESWKSRQAMATRSICKAAKRVQITGPAQWPSQSMQNQTTCVNPSLANVARLPVLYFRALMRSEAVHAVIRRKRRSETIFANLRRAW